MNPVTLASSLLVAGLLATPYLHAREPGAARDTESLVAAALRQLPEEALKSRYRQCSRAALRSSLGTEDIKLCSLVYEALLQHAFHGDFFALLNWSRNDRVAEPAE